MNNTLYIPDTITVGFQSRTDTFTGKLGYVIYTDHKGKLRKEASWNSWRSAGLGSITVDNKPTQGHTLNKGVQRDGHWGTGRSVVRVWDPRDFEFEISIDNLIGVLMHADVCKRDITESCVFAWKGTELILLPTNSVEYQESVKHTLKQSVKFSARDLVVGHTYGDKRDSSTWVYLGRHQQYEPARALADGDSGRESYYRRLKWTGQRLAKVKHVFASPDGLTFEIRDPSFISGVISDEVSANVAKLLDAYFGKIKSQPWKGITASGDIPSYYLSGRGSHQCYVALDDKRLIEIAISPGNYLTHMISFSAARVYLYDHENQRVHMTQPKLIGNYYSRSSAAPAVVVEGFSVDDEDVVSLIKSINDDYNQAVVGAPIELAAHESNSYHRSAEAIQASEQCASMSLAARSKVYTKYNFKYECAAILEDGKIAVIDYDYKSAYRIKD